MSDATETRSHLALMRSGPAIFAACLIAQLVVSLAPASPLAAAVPPSHV